MLDQMFNWNTSICMMIDNNYRIDDIFEKYKGDIKIMYYLASRGYYLKELVEYDESWIHKYNNHRICDPKLPNSIVAYDVLIEVTKHINPSYFNLVISSKYYDKYSDIRIELVKRCDNSLLEVLIKDESAFVRAEVARRGYGIDVLIHDKEQIVRNAAAEYFIDNYNKKDMVDNNEEEK